MCKHTEDESDVQAVSFGRHHVNFSSRLEMAVLELTCFTMKGTAGL